MHGRHVLFFICVLVGTGVGCSASAVLDVALGFSDTFVPGRRTPLRVTVHQPSVPEPLSLRITQRVGNAWRGESTSEYVWRLDPEEIAELQLVIPIYDFAHPLEIVLLDDSDATIASETIALRPRHRESPFSIAIGALPAAITAESISVAPRALPVAWGAYDSVSRVWLGQSVEPLTLEQWEALGGYVLSGGTLIVLGGPGYYLIDSPSLRRLLPVTEVHLGPEPVNDGLLVGELRSGSRRIEDESGLLLAYAGRCGAGYVVLVAGGIASLESDPKRLALVEAAPPAAPLTLHDATGRLLADTALPRPDHAIAALVMILLLVGLRWATARPRRASRTVAWILVVGVSLAVSSGFYINRTNATPILIRSSTSLHVSSSFGLCLHSSGLFATLATLATLPSNGHPPDEALPQDLNDHHYGVLWNASEGLRVSLDRGEGRVLETTDTVTGSLHVILTQTKIAVAGAASLDLDEAWLLRDGAAHSLGKVRVGDPERALGRAETGTVRFRDERFDTIFQAVAAHGFVDEGAWLVGGRERPPDEAPAIGEATTHLDFYVIGEERHAW